MKAHEILNAAAGHMQDRASTYDKPEGERSMGATVAAFYAITGHALTDEQGWLFMALLKMVRSQQGEFRSDSYEDGAAYFALAGEAAHADRKPTVQWQEVRAAARMVAEMESERVENSGIPNLPAIDSGPMWTEDDERRMDVVAQNGDDGAAYAGKGPCLGCGGPHPLHRCGRDRPTGEDASQ